MDAETDRALYETYAALCDLKKSVDKQAELQDETNNCLRALNEMLGHAVTAVSDLNETLSKQKLG